MYMDTSGLSPKTRKKSPFQKELAQKMKDRKSKGLAVELSSGEESDAISPSEGEDDLLSQFNMTMKFPKKEAPSGASSTLPTAKPRVATAVPKGPPSVSQWPSLVDKNVLDRKSPLEPLSDARKSPSQMTPPRISPVAALRNVDSPRQRFDIGGQPQTPLGSDAGGKSRSHLGSDADVVPNRQTDSIAKLPGNSSFTAKKLLDSDRNIPDASSFTSRQKADIMFGRQSPGTIQKKEGSDQPFASKKPLESDRKSPDASSLTSGQKADVIFGRQSPGTVQKKDGSDQPFASKKPLESDRKSPDASSLMSRQKADIIFGRQSPGIVDKKKEASDEPLTKKLSDIFGVGAHKKIDAKKPSSELDMLLAEDKLSKEEQKVWKPPQFKTAASPALSEEGRKTPSRYDEVLSKTRPSAHSPNTTDPSNGYMIPKPKPRMKGHDSEKTSQPAPTSSGRATPLSEQRTSSAASDGSIDDERSVKSGVSRASSGKAAAPAGKKFQEYSGRKTPTDGAGRKEGSVPAVDIFGKKPKSPILFDGSKAVSKAKTPPPEFSSRDTMQKPSERKASARWMAEETSSAKEADDIEKRTGSNDHRIARGHIKTPPESNKKGYLQSLLGLEGEDKEHGEEAVQGRQGYLQSLLQTTPKEKQADAKRVQQTAKHGLDNFWQPSEDNFGSIAQPDFGRRPRSKEGNSAAAIADDNSSVCYDVEKDPSQIEREKSEREAKFRRNGKKPLTEKQEAELRIDEVSDAQSSVVIRPIEPDDSSKNQSHAGRKTPVKPKARYGQMTVGDSLSPTPSFSRSFDSTTDIRQYIYEEWKRAKAVRAREEQKVQTVKEKEDEEKKKKEMIDKLSSSKASYDSWKETKTKALMDATKAKKEEDSKKKEQEREEAASKAAAQQAFKLWKKQKDSVIKSEQKKAKKDEHEKTETLKEEKKHKEKDSTSAFVGWKSTKDKVLTQTLKEERKRQKMEEEEEQRAQQESEKKAEELYHEWIRKKEEQKQLQRKLRRERKLRELENPRPAWSPANKTVPYGR